MSLIKKLKKHEIIVYILATFVLTWVFWSLSFTSSSGTLSFVFRILGTSTPSAMSLILTYYFYGAKEIKELLKKLFVWKVNPLFYLFILFYTIVSLYIPSFICTLAGTNYRININYELPGFHLTNLFMALLYLLAIIFFGGPLGEELGWRGFVLPKLQRKSNPLLASVIVGTIWVCWHLPMFLFHIEGYNDVNFILYLYGTICLAIIYTWLYNNTNGSLLIPILYHGIDNFVLLICHPDFLNYINSYTIIYYLVQLIFLTCVVTYMLRKSSNKASEKK